MNAPLDPLLDPETAIDADDGVVVLPGCDQPDWLWPVLVVSFAALIAWLAIFGPTSDDPIADPSSSSATAAGDDVVTDDTSAAGVTADESALAATGEAAIDGPNEGVGGSVDVEAGVVDPIGDAEDAQAAADPAVEATDLDLPEAGVVRFDGVDHPIVHSCVAVAPLAPASTTDLVSTHLIGDAGGVEPVVPIVERWFTADGVDGVRVDFLGGELDADAGDVVAEVFDGPNGAFAGQIELADGTTVDLAVNPPAEGDERLACADGVVTNEPAQFAFPYTRPVITVCRSGDPAIDGGVDAVLSEGARMFATANDDGSHTLRLVVAATPLTEGLDLVDEAGELFVDGDRFGYSGLVTDGTLSRDLTFDVDTSGAPDCA